MKNLNLNFNTYQLFQFFPVINYKKPIFDRDSEFFQYELFPLENNDEKEEKILPKRRNQLESDLVDLESKLTILDVKD